MITQSSKIVGSLAAFVLAAGYCGPALLGQGAQVPFHPQQAPSWCWAASSQMVLESASPSGAFSQAAQAELTLGQLCPKAPTETCDGINIFFGPCDSPGFPTFGDFKFAFEKDPSPQLWPELKAELDACRPVLFGWCQPGSCDLQRATSRGHFMVAAAADVCARETGGNVPMVRVYNPAPCCVGKKVWIPYSIYATGGAAMKFWLNEFGVRPEGQARPTTADTGCQITTAAADPVANFESTSDPAKLVEKVFTSCFPNAERWNGSGLSRSGEAVDFGGPPIVDPPVRRRLVSMQAISGLHASDAGWKMLRDSQAFPRLLVYPVRVGVQLLANVVLEQTAANQYRLQAIEDSESANTLKAQIAKLGPGGAVTEVVPIEIGSPILSRDGAAVMVTSGIDCRQPSQGGDGLEAAELKGLLQRLAPFSSAFPP